MMVCKGERCDEPLRQEALDTSRMSPDHHSLSHSPSLEIPQSSNRLLMIQYTYITSYSTISDDLKIVSNHFLFFYLR